ncbi:MAG: DUF4403 family protein [Myxococcales bacterium]|nr:DUF4403 family protein [Myxococcales bacterium]
MILRCAPLLLLALLVGSCGGVAAEPVARPGSDPGGPVCAVVLPPAKKGPESTAWGVEQPPKVNPPSSLLVVHATLDLERPRAELERVIAQRVAEGSRDGGMAGRIDYTVDRGDLQIRSKGGKLVIAAPLFAHAKACKGSSCYARCDPELRLTASVPLTLRSDYSFSPSEVHLEVVRGCVIKALGFMRIDVTPMLMGGLDRERARIAKEIDRRLPDLRADVERFWQSAVAPRPLPGGGCLLPRPTALVLVPGDDSATSVRLRLGVTLRPELRAQCGDVPAAPPLPRLGAPRKVPMEGTVHLVQRLTEHLPDLGKLGPVDLGPATARLHAEGHPAHFVVHLEGETCGTVMVGAGSMDLDPAGRTAMLSNLRLGPGEQERLRAVDLDPALLLGAIGSGRMALPLTAEGLRQLAPAMGAGLSTEELQVEPRFARIVPVGATWEDGGVVVQFEIHGHIDIHAR